MRRFLALRASATAAAADKAAKEEAARITREADIRRLYEIGTQLEVLEQLYNPAEVAKVMEKVDKERELLQMLEDELIVEHANNSNNAAEEQVVAPAAVEETTTGGDTAEQQEEAGGDDNNNNDDSNPDISESRPGQRKSQRYSLRFASIDIDDLGGGSETFSEAKLALDDSAVSLQVDGDLDSVATTEDVNDDNEQSNNSGDEVSGLPNNPYGPGPMDDLMMELMGSQMIGGDGRDPLQDSQISQMVGGDGGDDALQDSQITDTNILLDDSSREDGGGAAGSSVGNSTSSSTRQDTEQANVQVTIEGVEDGLPVVVIDTPAQEKNSRHQQREQAEKQDVENEQEHNGPPTAPLDDFSDVCNDDNKNEAVSDDNDDDIPATKRDAAEVDGGLHSHENGNDTLDDTPEAVVGGSENVSDTSHHEDEASNPQIDDGVDRDESDNKGDSDTVSNVPGEMTQSTEQHQHDDPDLIDQTPDEEEAEAMETEGEAMEEEPIERPVDAMSEDVGMEVTSVDDDEELVEGGGTDQSNAEDIEEDDASVDKGAADGDTCDKEQHQGNNNGVPIGARQLGRSEPGHAETAERTVTEVLVPAAHHQATVFAQHNTEDQIIIPSATGDEQLTETVPLDRSEQSAEPAENVRAGNEETCVESQKDDSSVGEKPEKISDSEDGSGSCEVDIVTTEVTSSTDEGAGGSVDEPEQAIEFIDVVCGPKGEGSSPERFNEPEQSEVGIRNSSSQVIEDGGVHGVKTGDLDVGTPAEDLEQVKDEVIHRTDDDTGNERRTKKEPIAGDDDTCGAHTDNASRPLEDPNVDIEIEQQLTDQPLSPLDLTHAEIFVEEILDETLDESIVEEIVQDEHRPFQLDEEILDETLDESTVEEIVEDDNRPSQVDEEILDETLDESIVEEILQDDTRPSQLDESTTTIEEILVDNDDESSTTTVEEEIIEEEVEEVFEEIVIVEHHLHDLSIEEEVISEEEGSSSSTTASEYEDQVIHKWVDKDEEPDDYEAAVNGLAALVYKDGEANIEKMKKRTPLPELYRYLKQQYWYKIHMKTTDQAAGASVVQAVEDEELEKSQTLSVDDMLANRMNRLLHKIRTGEEIKPPESKKEVDPSSVKKDDVGEKLGVQVSDAGKRMFKEALSMFQDGVKNSPPADTFESASGGEPGNAESGQVVEEMC